MRKHVGTLALPKQITGPTPSKTKHQACNLHEQFIPFPEKYEETFWLTLTQGKKKNLPEETETEVPW